MPYPCLITGVGGGGGRAGVYTNWCIRHSVIYRFIQKKVKGRLKYKTHMYFICWKYKTLLVVTYFRKMIEYINNTYSWNGKAINHSIWKTFDALVNYAEGRYMGKHIDLACFCLSQ